MSQSTSGGAPELCTCREKYQSDCNIHCPFNNPLSPSEAKMQSDYDEHEFGDDVQYPEELFFDFDSVQSPLDPE